MNYNFLHNHPNTEKHLNLDEDHVIVDKKDWEEARSITLAHQKGYVYEIKFTPKELTTIWLVGVVWCLWFLYATYITISSWF